MDGEHGVSLPAEKVVERRLAAVELIAERRIIEISESPLIRGRDWGTASSDPAVDRRSDE